MSLSFTERYQQARLYAAQVRVRREMGPKYLCYKPINKERKCEAAIPGARLLLAR
jgi:hypothetical protein